ncbi:hypothetical protein [Acidisphaera sp. S103]|uniref:hypothetical protein n=1 Tax=Acidisphaera sp. S103 TaxID=1747223 RepID=UPI00131EC2C3|nr:hypothetical protein [Acidisphaera sp. S103]
MPHPATITTAVFEKIIAFLAPLFLIPGTSDIATARETAITTLASYGARTDRELRFAALSIAFGFGALEALSKAAAPDLPLNHALRLRGNANALNRAAQQNENRLEKLQRQPEAAETEEHAENAMLEALADPLPTSNQTADLLAFVRAQVKSMRPTADLTSAPVVPLSRQQRRAAERRAEKMRQRQQEEAKRAQRLATTRQSMRIGI